MTCCTRPHPICRIASGLPMAGLLIVAARASTKIVQADDGCAPSEPAACLSLMPGGMDSAPLRRPLPQLA